MKYQHINNPEELMKFMDEDITYGFVDEEGKIYSGENMEQFEYGCRNKWKLSSPEKLLKVGYGHCYDQVELERDWFSKNKYNFKTFYIMFELEYINPYSTHTYLVYEKDNKYYLFEHADSMNKGIKVFDSYKDAVNYQMTKHIEFNRKYNKLKDEELSSLHVYEYSKPDYNCSMEEFIDNIVEGKISRRVL